MTGARIVQASWASVVLLAIVGVLDMLVDGFDGVAVGVCVVLFLGSLPIWLYALGRAAARSTRGDDIAVMSLFFLQGSAPAPVRNAVAVGVRGQLCRRVRHRVGEPVRGARPDAAARPHRPVGRSLRHLPAAPRAGR